MNDNTVLILNGPGLADLSVAGDRYGNLTLAQIRNACSALCDKLGMHLEFRQTDDKEEIIRWIAQDSENFSALMINPVGFGEDVTVDFDGYCSAIEMMADPTKPVIEVHLTNIFREGAELTKPLQGPAGAMGFICGLGINSYLLGISAIAARLQN